MYTVGSCLSLNQSTIPSSSSSLLHHHHYFSCNGGVVTTQRGTGVIFSIQCLVYTCTRKPNKQYLYLCPLLPCLTPHFHLFTNQSLPSHPVHQLAHLSVFTYSTHCIPEHHNMYVSVPVIFS